MKKRSYVTIFLALLATSASAQSWKPDRPVEFIVAGGEKGGTDQFMRTIQSIITKYKLIPTSTSVTNKGANNGAEGFLEIKAAKGSATKLIAGTNNGYLLPMIAKAGFSKSDLVPVAMLAQDNFVLWAKSDLPFKTAAEYIQAVKTDPGSYRMGGSQTKDVDQTLTSLLNSTMNTKLMYIPFKSGAEASSLLVKGLVTSNVNNPSESIQDWKEGKVKPLCVFSNRPMANKEKVTSNMAWSDIPTCASQGIKISSYVLPRMIYMPAGAAQQEIQYYQDVLKKVTQTKEWKDYLERNALSPAYKVDSVLNLFMQEDERRAQKIFAIEDWLIR